MGNCLNISFQPMIKAEDRMVLACRRPPYLKADDLSWFPGGGGGGHAISETSLPVVQHLDRPEADVVMLGGGKLYYDLLPPNIKALPVLIREANYKININEQGRTSKMVRIKLVVRKEELKEMLSSKGGGGGRVSLIRDQLISIMTNNNIMSADHDHQMQQSRRGGYSHDVVAAAGGADNSDCMIRPCRSGWKPALESIPESND